MKESQNEEMCPNCERNPATEPHTCPAQVEVNSDHDFLCNCCERCQERCAEDV